MIENLEKMWFPSSGKKYMPKTIANSIFHGKILEAIFFQIKNKSLKSLLSTCLVNIVLEQGQLNWLQKT